MNEIIIEVKNISKVYDEMTDNPVISLNNISMSIEKGEFICVMGTSGSGKTTFINCISTMDTPSKGQVILFGKSTLEVNKLYNLLNVSVHYCKECNLYFDFYESGQQS